MQQAFIAFLQDPVKEHFLKVRDLVSTHPSYEPYSSDLDDLQNLFAEEKYEEVQNQFMNSFPNLLLSPRLHLLAGLAARKAGQDENADVELAIYEQCVAGILNSGDGTEQNPYLVLRTSDEYDVLDFLEKKVQRQALINREDRDYDVITCEDGDVWFDITVPFQALNRNIGEAGDFERPEE